MEDDDESEDSDNKSLLSQDTTVITTDPHFELKRSQHPLQVMVSETSDTHYSACCLYFPGLVFLDFSVDSTDRYYCGGITSDRYNC